MIGAAIKAFVAPWLQPLLIAALVATSAWCFYKEFQVRSLRAEVAELRAEMVAAVAKADEERQAIERDADETLNQSRIEHAKALADQSARYERVVAGLRADAARAALKPAATAPAECSGYAADPTRLSVPHAEFLVGEADRADRVVLELQRCERDYAGLVEAVNKSRE